MYNVGLAESENLMCEVTVQRKCSEGGGVEFLPQLEAEFLDEIQSKVLRIFLLAIQRHLHSFALRFIFLQTRATSYSFYSVLVYTVKEKGGKHDRKSHPLPYCFRKSIQLLKYENSLRLCPETSKKLCVQMNSASGVSRLGEICIFYVVVE